MRGTLVVKVAWLFLCVAVLMFSMLAGTALSALLFKAAEL
jgi:hypothetical protein